MLPRVLSLDRSALLHGQVWRLPHLPGGAAVVLPLWILFNLYFTCLLGRGLEQQWGVFRFNLYYLCGMVGAILTCLITGYGTNYYLNLSLFLAFAAFYPDYRLMLSSFCRSRSSISPCWTACFCSSVLFWRDGRIGLPFSCRL